MDKSKQYEYKNVDLKKNILIEIKIDLFMDIEIGRWAQK